MKQRNKLKQLVVGTGLIFATLGNPTMDFAQEDKKKSEKEVQLIKGYNAIENGFLNYHEFKARLLTNLNLNLYGFSIGYKGINENTYPESNQYFGRNMVTVGKKDAKNAFTAVLKSGNQGIFDIKFGISNKSLIEKMKGFGSLEAVLDKDAANITSFYGKNLGKGFTLGIFQSTELPFKERLYNYLEVQVNKNMTKNWDLFGRIETQNFDKGKISYLGGLSYKF